MKDMSHLNMIISFVEGKEYPIGIKAGSYMCDHCMDYYTVNLPASIEIVAAIAKAFQKMHRSCNKKSKHRHFTFIYEKPSKCCEEHPNCKC